MRVQDMGLGLDSSLPLDERRVGIEVEVEGCTNHERVVMGWMMKPDASLREHGCEWVTRPELKASVPQLLEWLYHDFHEFKWVANLRTGIHVHVDVRDLVISQLRAVAMAYALTERAFCEVAGAVREENIYCVPWYRAPREAVTVMQALTSTDTIRALQHTVKYVGLYFEPITRFGTVEFRHAPTWDNAEQTQEWVDMCYALVEYASTCEDALDVYEIWESMTPSNFAHHVCGYRPKNPAEYDAWFNNTLSEGVAVRMLDVVHPAEDEGSEDFFTFDEMPDIVAEAENEGGVDEEQVLENLMSMVDEDGPATVNWQTLTIPTMWTTTGTGD